MFHIHKAFVANGKAVGRGLYGVLTFLLLVGVCCGVLTACGDKHAASGNANGNATIDQTAKAQNSAETLFNQSCVSCHLSGVAGAPKKGDTVTWQKKLNEQGIDALVANVRTGLGAMPPMGMCNQCSDEDFKIIIQWMAAPK